VRPRRRYADLCVIAIRTGATLEAEDGAVPLAARLRFQPHRVVPSWLSQQLTGVDADVESILGWPPGAVLSGITKGADTSATGGR